MRRTGLFEEHQALQARIVDFHGWEMPVQYAGIVHEHKHTREKASIFDCSHMGEFVLRGAAAIEAYGRLVISDVDRIGVGRGRYGMLLNDEAGIIDDVISIRLADDELYVVSNAGTLDAVGGLMADAGAEDVSGVTSKIDVQGPEARAAMEAVGLGEASTLRYFGARRMVWRNAPLVVTRMGYTGELGYELYVPDEAAPALWRALLEVEGVEPAGLGARDTLRLEVGYPLSGQDFGPERTPLEANAAMFVAWGTAFPGRERLVEQREEGAYDVLTAIRTTSRRAPRHGFDVYDGASRVGEVTSGTFGPSVGHGIGLAYVPRALSEPGHELAAGPRGLTVFTEELPFYRQGTCRSD
jgi:aminomethyltransferase